MLKVYTIILVLFFLGCKDDINYEKPEGLLKKSEMIDVLYDMHLAVGTSNLPNIYLEKNRNYMALIYKKYGIDSTRFAESNLYYTSHIQEYEEIFEEVERRLKDLRDFHQNRMDSILEIQTGRPETRRIRDSIKKVRNLQDRN